jgi:hypothetical protein
MYLRKENLVNKNGNRAASDATTMKRHNEVLLFIRKCGSVTVILF